MAILDIISFSLIDSQLMLEDVFTSAGRVWHALLQSICEKQGYLSASWGRLHQNPGSVILFIVWVDKESRDRFYNEGLGTAAMDYYLQHPATVRYLLNGDLSNMLEPEGLTIWIESLQKDSNDPLVQEAAVTWEDYKLSMSTSAVASPLGGELHSRIITRDKNVLDILQTAIVMTLSSKNLETQISAGSDRKRGSLGINAEIIPLRTQSSNPPISTPDLDLPSKISQLFSRDANYFSRSTSPINTMMKIEGPQLSWRSPQDLSRVGNTCFLNGAAAPPPSVKYSHVAPSKPAKTYLETISLIFRKIVPNLEDDHTETGIAWRAYRRHLLSQTRCLKVFVFKDHATPQNVDMFVEWKTIEDAKNFHVSPQTTDSRNSLVPHLTVEPQITPSLGTLLNLDHDYEWAEMVDFELTSISSQAERRAVEYYVENFNQTMEGFESFIDPAVSANIRGWIEGPPGSNPKYRVLYDWKGPAEELQWVAEFMQAPYMLTGYRAHWVALAVNAVIGKHISLKQERLETLTDRSKEDEDLGF